MRLVLIVLPQLNVINSIYFCLLFNLKIILDLSPESKSLKFKTKELRILKLL